MLWKFHICCSPAELRQLPGQDHRGGLWKDWGQWFGCEGIENCWAEIRIFCCMSVTDATFLQLSSIYLRGRSQKMGLTKYFCSGRNLPIWPFSVKISPSFLSWLPEVNITAWFGIVQVKGELSKNKEVSMRRFMQTFILAPQQSPKKYYVRSDILRYLHEVFTILLHTFVIIIIKSSKHHYIVLFWNSVVLNKQLRT